MEDPGRHQHQNGPPFPPQSKSFMGDLIQAGSVFVQDYGWFLLFGILIIAFIWKKYLEPYRSSVAQQETVGFEKKNEDSNVILARHEALSAARQRMQDEQNRLSALAKEEIAKRDEEKRKKMIGEWERHKKGDGYYSKARPAEEPTSSSGTSVKKSQPKKPLKQDDYNPLSGSGGCGYRPGRRYFGGGGG